MKLRTIVLVGVVLFATKFAMASEMITATLLDHVSPVTQFKNGETKLALVDSVVLIGSKDGKSLFDLQAGFSGETKPQSNEVTGANLIVGGFFKVSSLVQGKLKLPAHWEFLRAIEHGPVYFYDFREKRGYLGYQVGLAFELQPK